MRAIIGSVLWSVLLGAVLGCGGDKSQGAVKTIGPTGGAIQVDGFRIEIPPGALSESVEISVQTGAQIPDVDAKAPVSPAFQVLPADLRLNVPAKVIVTYIADKLPAHVEPSAIDLRKADARQRISILGGLDLSVSTTQVSGTTDSLALFWAVSPIGPAVGSVVVSPDPAVVGVGQQGAFTAEVRDPGGALMTGLAVAWKSSDPSVATVDAGGLATAVGPGNARIVATASQVSGSATLFVRSGIAPVSAFQFEQPQPTGNDLLGLFADVSELTAVGSAGTVVRRDASGLKPVWSQDGLTLRAVAAHGGYRYYAGNDGTFGLVITEEPASAGGKRNTLSLPAVDPRAICVDAAGGLLVGAGEAAELANGAWAPLHSPVSEALLAVQGNGAGLYTVVGSLGSILTYDIASKVWTALSPSRPLKSMVLGAAFLPGGEIIAASATGLFHYAAASWTMEPLPSAPAIQTVTAVGAAGTRVLLAGTSSTGASYLFARGPAGWTSLALPSGRVGRAFAGRSDTEGYAAGDHGTLYTYDGGTFTALSSGALRDIEDVAFSGTEGYAVGSRCVDSQCQTLGGEVLKRDAVTGLWSPVSGPFSFTPLHAAVADASQVFVGGDFGEIFKLSATGWSRVNNAGFSAIRDLALCGGLLVAVAEDGSFLTYDGSSMVDRTPWAGQGVSLWGVWCNGQNDLVVVGDWVIVKYDGMGWTQIDTMKDQIRPAQWRAVWGNGRGQYVFGGQARYLVTYDGAHSVAIDQPGGTTPLWIRALVGSSIGDLYAAGNAAGGAGLVLRYDGADWTPLSSGSSRAILGAYAAGPGDIWLVGEGGALLHGK